MMIVQERAFLKARDQLQQIEQFVEQAAEGRSFLRWSAR